MACQILVSYQCSVATGEIIGVFDGAHKFSAKESLSSWLAKDPSNTRDTWHRNFTVVRITDKELQDLLYLEEPLLVGGELTAEGTRKYYFTTPTSDDPAYGPLNTTGEIEVPWSFASGYIVERS